MLVRIIFQNENDLSKPSAGATPEEGNHLIRSGFAKSMISKVATKKAGTAYNNANVRELHLSKKDPKLLPAFTPIGILIKNAIKIPAIEKNSVYLVFSNSCRLTDLPVI